MKRINILIILFVSVFFIGITSVKAGWAEEENALDELKDANSNATLGRYCHYTKTGFNKSNGKYDVIVALSSDLKYAGADVEGGYMGLGQEGLKGFIPGNGCPEAVMVRVNHHEIPIIGIDVLPSRDLYAVYTLGDALNKYSDKDDTIYFLVDNLEDTNIYMTCNYSFENSVHRAIFYGDKTVENNLELSFNKDKRIVGINKYKYFDDNGSLAPDFFFGALSIGDVCPALYLCNNKDASTGTRIYLSDYQNSADPESCEVIYCTNTNDSHCKPGSDDARVCAGFNYYTNVDEKVRYCESVLKYTNFKDECAQKCIDYLDSHKSETYKNTPVGECGFSTRMVVWIENILRWVKYIIPVLIIVLSILDFVKAIASEKEDELKKAQKHFVTRLIVAILIFIAPMIIEFILNKLGFDANSCGISNLGLEK